ncbi:sensor histidine kinase [Pleurocapsa sp. PCC 7319]|uniref:sensor histidine kinase n=1 Tax=Pleurocapsa sp. PCC 7319 TaxID=118161 RepID=UPI000348A8B9|nr:sensor histidine kinase [Pleurocapsa sp. PCC 7319]
MLKTQLTPPLSFPTDTQQSNNTQHHFSNHNLALSVAQLTNQVRAERQMRQKLAHAHEQLQQYSQKIEELATIQERNRIARELHDSLGHALTSLNIQMQTALKLWDKEPEQAHSFLAQAQQLGKTAIKEVRQSISSLREDAQDEKPLAAKIDVLVDDCRRGTGLDIDTNISCCGSVPSPVAQNVYRIVQEALTNIFKYAQATKVQINLKSTPEGIYLTVEDNGKGFDLNQKRSGFGLQGMQERVASVNGHLQLKTSPGNGCRIEVEISCIKASPQTKQEEEFSERHNNDRVLSMNPERQEEKAATLETENQALLERSWRLDGQTSSQPSSSDELKKTRKNRMKIWLPEVKLQTGGQESLSGKRWEQVSKPDLRVNYSTPNIGSGEGFEIKKEKVISVSRRKALEIPEPRMSVWENQGKVQQFA